MALNRCNGYDHRDGDGNDHFRKFVLLDQLSTDELRFFYKHCFDQHNDPDIRTQAYLDTYLDTHRVAHSRHAY